MKIPLFKIQTSNTRGSGFTLVEILLYLAIFGATIGGVLGLAQSSLSHRVKNQVIAEVNYQAEAVITAITQAVHDATAVTAPTAGNSATSLTLSMPTSSVNPTLFESFNDGSTNRLRMSEGSPAVRNYLTNSHVSLDNLQFVNAAVSGGKSSVKFQFNLSYKSDSTRQEHQFSRTFYGAANIK